MGEIRSSGSDSAVAVGSLGRTRECDEEEERWRSSRHQFPVSSLIPALGAASPGGCKQGGGAPLLSTSAPPICGERRRSMVVLCN